MTDKTSMLNQDMGVRAVLTVANDIFYANAVEWGLDRWLLSGTDLSAAGLDDVDLALVDLGRARFRAEMKALARSIACFDWRSFDGPEVELEEGRIKRSYRGSGGYAALAEDVMRVVSQDNDAVGQTAQIILSSVKS